jgi:endoglucanase
MAFDVHRGTNISHWLSQSKVRGVQRRAWFTEEDVKRIAGWGFDHIRLPVDEVQLWADDGSREEEAFQLLDNALNWCASAGLRVIVDLHILRSHYFNSETEPALYSDPAALEKFAALWRDLSAFLRARPVDQVAYEMLNEAVAKEPASWNRVSRHIFDMLRALEPERTIVLGSNEWNQYKTYPDLDIPQDMHLLLTFHYYNPMFITHHRASWMDLGHYTGPIQYPGLSIPPDGLAELDRVLPGKGRQDNVYFDRDVIKQHMLIPHKIARETGHALYCGEFGCIHFTPPDIQRRWYSDIISVFNELGIRWANWDYKGGFGLLRPDTGQETVVLEALMQG